MNDDARTDDDELEGPCDVWVELDPIDNDEVDGTVLFADLDPDDPQAVEERELEYVALFAPELEGFTKADFSGA